MYMVIVLTEQLYDKIILLKCEHIHNVKYVFLKSGNVYRINRFYEACCMKSIKLNKMMQSLDYLILH